MNPLRAKAWPRKVRHVEGPEAEIIKARYAEELSKPAKKPRKRRSY